MVADSIAELAVTSQTASAPTFTADPTPPNGRKAENGGGVECACAGGAVCAFATGSPHDRGRELRLCVIRLPRNHFFQEKWTDNAVMRDLKSPRTPRRVIRLSATWGFSIRTAFRPVGSAPRGRPGGAKSPVTAIRVHFSPEKRFGRLLGRIA
jgi:hypothetical protein